MELKKEVFKKLLNIEMALGTLKGGGAVTLPLLIAKRRVLFDIVDNCQLTKEYMEFRSADKRWKK